MAAQVDGTEVAAVVIHVNAEVNLTHIAGWSPK